MIPRNRILPLVLVLALALGWSVAGPKGSLPPDARSHLATGPQDPPPPIPVSALQEDLGTLWSILDEGHGALERFSSRDDLQRMFDESAKGLTTPLTEVEFYKRALPLIAAIKDGHTRLELSPAAGRLLDSNAAYFPFDLRITGRKVFVFRNLSPDAGIRGGSEILAVNGLETAEILTRLMADVPSDAGIETGKRRLLENPWAFGRLLAVELGAPATYNVRFRLSPDDAPREASVPGIKAAELAAVLERHSKERDGGAPGNRLTFKGKTAVLSIRALADEGAAGHPAFPDFLKQAFADIAKSGASGLIIDLRECGGGRDDHAKLLFAHVATQPFVYYQSMEAKKDRYDLFKYTSETAAAAEDFARSVQKNDRGTFDVFGHPNSGPQSPERPVFAGRVAVLIGGGSASASGEAILLFHYNRRATFFGEESGAAYGGTTGYIVTAALPHSGLRVRFPLVLTKMAAAEYPRDRGLLPEVPVAPGIGDLLAGRDPVMDRALAFLEKDEVAEDVSPTRAKALIDSASAASRMIFLDVRTPAEFAEGHLTGALNIDFRSADFAARLEGLDKAAAYLVYCRGGVRSFAAMGRMKSAGFLKVYNLQGGFLRWREEIGDLVEKCSGATRFREGL